MAETGPAAGGRNPGPDLPPLRLPEFFCIGPEDFDAQIRWLTEQGLVVSLEDVQAFVRGGKSLRNGSVLITIDDGFLSTYRRPAGAGAGLAERRPSPIAVAICSRLKLGPPPPKMDRKMAGPRGGSVLVAAPDAFGCGAGAVRVHP